MERYEQLIQEIRNIGNDLEEFIRNFKSTSLQPPMPRQVYYTTPEVLEKARQRIETLRTTAIELQGEVEEVIEDLEDLENPRR